VKKPTTVSTTGMLKTGDIFTIAGIYEPDRRWWPRLKAWVLNRPPPMSDRLQKFVAKSVVE
jgi:hypothetical protein